MRIVPQVTVGHAGADIVGADHRALQAAVDYVAGLGQGVVQVGPGVYAMGDSLHLRSGVRVVGAGADTVLRADDGVTSPLVLDGDYGEEQVTVADAAGFYPGCGITVADERSGGFHVTVTRVVAVEGNVLHLAQPLLADYMVAQGAVAQRGFPVVSGYHVRDIAIENLTIDGNRDANAPLTGCRGAGIFLYRGHGTRISGCAVRRFNGDGISFQQSDDVVVEDCLCAENAQLGLHPGSGSQRPTIRRCTSRDNGQIGLFLCWRVRHGTFDDNVLEGNGFAGISIGHKDTDNVFRRNRSAGNHMWGVYFRDESEPMAGHRNVFIGNTIVDNGTPDEGGGVRVDGETHDLEFEHNEIGSAARPSRQRVGLSAGPGARRITLRRNRIEGNGVAALESEAGEDVWLHAQ